MHYDLLQYPSHVTSYNQWLCFTSAKHSYAFVKFVYDISSWLLPNDDNNIDNDNTKIHVLKIERYLAIDITKTEH